MLWLTSENVTEECKEIVKKKIEYKQIIVMDYLKKNLNNFSGETISIARHMC